MFSFKMKDKKKGKNSSRKYVSELTSHGFAKKKLHNLKGASEAFV